MPSLSQALGATRRGDASARLTLVIVCAGVVLASLDLFIVNIALPDMARDLHAHGLGGLSWVLNAYAIVYAALLVLFGRLAERRPRELGFLLGVAVFTLASAACGAASSVAMLIVFRIVQASGAALLTPTSLSLVLATTPPERRHGAVRAWTAIGGLAAALGPVVGGLLVAASWRWVFLVNVPIGLVALFVGWRRLPHVAGHPVPAPDALGALLVTGGVATLTLALVQGSPWGWDSTATVGMLALSAILLGLFVLHCMRHRNPLIDRTLFRSRGFVGASTVALFFSAAFGAMLLSIVLWEQNVWGWSALRSGLALAPGPLMVPLFSFLVAGRLIPRIGAGPVIAGGSTAFAVGVALWALTTGQRPDYVSEMLPGMLLTGIGVGLTLPTFMATAAGSLPPQAFATGSAVVNMLRQVGLALGVAALIALLGDQGAPTDPLSAFPRGWWAIAGAALLAGASGLVLLRPRRRAAQEPQARRPEPALAVPGLGSTPPAEPPA
ncbi:MAG TPA: MFS transporter [Solirubrobacteraceae bacterium]|jgi:EmrB/QacA subfamily drug resistance transporter